MIYFAVKEKDCFTEWYGVTSDKESNSPMLQALATSMTSITS